MFTHMNFCGGSRSDSLLQSFLLSSGACTLLSALCGGWRCCALVHGPESKAFWGKKFDPPFVSKYNSVILTDREGRWNKKICRSISSLTRKGGTTLLTRWDILQLSNPRASMTPYNIALRKKYIRMVFYCFFPKGKHAFEGKDSGSDGRQG